MSKTKKYSIGGEYYTLNQLIKMTGKSRYVVRMRLKQNASTLYELCSKEFNVPPNWKSSMMCDMHGHWKLLAKALGC